MSKRFFYVSLGVLMLAVAFALGSLTARADEGAGVPVIVAAGGSGGDLSPREWVVTSTGDIYVGSVSLEKPCKRSVNVFTGKVAK